MSTEKIQPDGLGPTAGFHTATLPKRFVFMKLPVEILMIIITEMTAAELPLFRSLCRASHDFVTVNEHSIVFSVLKNDLYRTASKLYYRHIYHPHPPPYILHVNDLYQVARRCDSARHLASLLAQNHFIDLIRTSEHTGIGPNHAYSVTKVAENIYPYLIGLFHFLENFRHDLATFVADPRYANSVRTPGSQVEIRLVAQYTKETVYRISSLFHLLTKIVRLRVPWNDLMSMSSILRLLPIADYIEPDRCKLDLFILGGLEAFRDIVAQNSVSARVDYLLAHYNQVMPIPLPFTYNRRIHTTLVPLPKPILPELSRQTAIDTCLRLPIALLILDLLGAGLWGYKPDLDRHAVEGRFLGYLATHEGPEPQLLR